MFVVTADFREDTEANLIEQNASAILYKPYDVEKLVQTIHDVARGILNYHEPLITILGF